MEGRGDKQGQKCHNPATQNYKSSQLSFPLSVHFYHASESLGKGVVAMANSGPSTNTSQFYITYKSAKTLDGKHTIFGKLVGGFEVLSKMEKIRTDDNDKPVLSLSLSLSLSLARSLALCATATSQPLLFTPLISLSPPNTNPVNKNRNQLLTSIFGLDLNIWCNICSCFCCVWYRF